MGKIILRNIQLYGKHGCYESEAILGGHYSLTITIDTNIAAAALSDDLTKTVDYEAIYHTCMSIFDKRHNLLESLAYKMAHAIKNNYEGVEHVEVELAKLHPPLPGHVESSVVNYKI